MMLFCTYTEPIIICQSVFTNWRSTIYESDDSGRLESGPVDYDAML